MRKTLISLGTCKNSLKVKEHLVYYLNREKHQEDDGRETQHNRKMLEPQLFMQFLTQLVMWQVVSDGSMWVHTSTTHNLLHCELFLGKNCVNSYDTNIIRHNNIKRFGARAQLGESPTSVLCGAMTYGSQIVGQACRHNKICMWGL